MEHSESTNTPEPEAKRDGPEQIESLPGIVRELLAEEKTSNIKGRTAEGWMQGLRKNWPILIALAP